MISHILRPWPTLAVAALLVAPGLPGTAGAEPRNTVADLVAAARRLNPDIAAMNLEADAATARITTAGSLEDPKLKFERSRPTNGSMDPRSDEIQISQMLPFFGKLDLKREIASWDARKARASARDIENQVAYRVKVAYAAYHGAHLAMEENRRLALSLRQLAEVARQRYAQGAAPQSDVTGVEAERGMLEAELAKLEAERQSAQARINRLLARNGAAALPPRPDPRPLPDPARLKLERLLARGHSESPALEVGRASVASAAAGQRLAERNFLPDVEIGVGAMREDNRVTSYKFMLEATIPLQWGRINAEQREASAMAGAARARADALVRDLEADLRGAHAMFVATTTRQRVLERTSIPQARTALESALSGYRVGTAEFSAVAAAEQTLRRAVIDSINNRYEQQSQLAEIERLIGGEL